MQKRCEDDWYHDVLVACRNGCLSEELYNFLHGFPTKHCGSWKSKRPEGEQESMPTEGYAQCGNATCVVLHESWASLARAGKSWNDMLEMECELCKQERQRRCRLVEPNDPRVKREPFLSAPFIHQNNEPKYHAALLRAEEHAKHNPAGTQRVLWIVAQDTPNNDEFRHLSAAQIQAKRRR